MVLSGLGCVSAVHVEKGRESNTGNQNFRKELEILSFLAWLNLSVIFSSDRTITMKSRFFLLLSIMSHN